MHYAFKDLNRIAEAKTFCNCVIPAVRRREKMFNYSKNEWAANLQQLSMLVNYLIPANMFNQSLTETIRHQLRPHPYQLHSREAVELLKQGLTPFEALLRGVPEFHTTLVGSPQMIADEMQRLFEAGACDGFVIVPDRTHNGFPVFVEELVPILQKRGLFHLDYEGITLCEHLRVPFRYGRKRNFKIKD